MRKTKTWSKTLAALLAVVMVMSAMVFVLPTSAASVATKYEALKIGDSSNMELDGVHSAREPWDAVEWNDDFSNKNAQNSVATFGAPRVKFLWSTDGTDTYLYLLMKFTDPNGQVDDLSDQTTKWMKDGMVIGIDESGSKDQVNTSAGSDAVLRKSDTRDTKVGAGEYGTGAGDDGTSSWLSYFVYRDGNEVSVEAKITFLTPETYGVANNVVGILLMAQPNVGGTEGDYYKQQVWNSAASNGNANRYGGVKLVDQTVEPTINVNYANTAPTIKDGLAADTGAWATAEWMYAKGSLSAAHGTQYSKVKFLWGKDSVGYNLYVLVKYKDYDISNNVFNWCGDGIYLGVDELGDQTGKCSTSPTTQTAVYRVGQYAGSGNYALDYYDTQRITSDDGTSVDVWMEIKIPLKNQDRAEIDNIIGLGLHIVSGNGVTSPSTATVFKRDVWGNDGADYDVSSADAASYGDLKLTGANVTTVNGSSTKSEIVALNTVYTLPAAVTMDAPFAGWTVDGALYPAGAEITVTEDITVTATSIGLSMQEGAAVRLSENTGMRWITYVDTANLASNITIVSKGTLIVPADYLTDGVEFTHAGLEAAGRQANVTDGYIDIAATEYVPAEKRYEDANGRDQFNGSITNINEANYERNFVAVGYVEVQYADGTTGYIYADYSETSRTVKYVAEQALLDTAANYNSAQLAVLRKFAGQ